MKITKITEQLKQPDRYSIYVDDQYAFSLSASTLLAEHIAPGDELSAAQLKAFKQLSSDDKLYNLVLRYIALRPRSEWEIKTYLERKKSPAPLIEQITNKLTTAGYVSDSNFARAYIHDRQLLRPTSRRKMILELRKKHVSNEVVQAIFEEAAPDEQATLQTLIVNKRRQTKYQDDLKLMQYLARQGFNYGDIKTALQVESED